MVLQTHPNVSHAADGVLTRFRCALLVVPGRLSPYTPWWVGNKILATPLPQQADFVDSLKIDVWAADDGWDTVNSRLNSDPKSTVNRLIDIVYTLSIQLGHLADIRKAFGCLSL